MAVWRKLEVITRPDYSRLTWLPYQITRFNNMDKWFLMDNYEIFLIFGKFLFVRKSWIIPFKRENRKYSFKEENVKYVFNKEIMKYLFF